MENETSDTLTSSDHTLEAAEHLGPDEDWPSSYVDEGLSVEFDGLPSLTPEVAAILARLIRGRLGLPQRPGTASR